MEHKLLSLHLRIDLDPLKARLLFEHTWVECKTVVMQYLFKGESEPARQNENQFRECKMILMSKRKDVCEEE